MARPRILPPEWFDRPTLAVARDLIGKFLVVRTPRGVRAAMITETEAYDGLRDRASHASQGRTARNAPMFGPPGRWYVYLVYGLHEMLNVVTRREGYPAAVLIRGAGEWDGPGKLTRALGVRRSVSGATVTPPTGVWLEDRGVTVPDTGIRRTPRVGVRYAGPAWSAKPWRFVLAEVDG